MGLGWNDAVVAVLFVILSGEVFSNAAVSVLVTVIFEVFFSCDF